MAADDPAHRTWRGLFDVAYDASAQPGTIPYFAKIEGVNGVLEEDLPLWQATTQVTGVQVTTDIAPLVVPDRTNVKSGDPVNFALIARNVSSTRIASHPVFDG